MIFKVLMCVFGILLIAIVFPLISNFPMLNISIFIGEFMKMLPFLNTFWDSIQNFHVFGFFFTLIITMFLFNLILGVTFEFYSSINKTSKKYHDNQEKARQNLEKEVSVLLKRETYKKNVNEKKIDNRNYNGRPKAPEPEWLQKWIDEYE